MSRPLKYLFFCIIILMADFMMNAVIIDNGEHQRSIMDISFETQSFNVDDFEKIKDQCLDN